MSEERDPPTPSLGNKRKRKRLQAETRVSRTGWVETFKVAVPAVQGADVIFTLLASKRK